MDPITGALLQSWGWRVDVIAVLVTAGTLYLLGWRRLRRIERAQKGPAAHRLATGRRLAAYLSGLVIVALALMSPIDVLGGQLFTFHMVQHLLLVMIAPPLLLLGNPFPFVLWGLWPRARSAAASLFKPKSVFRRGLRAATTPGIVWFTFVAVYVGWHDPNAYNAALRYEWLHDAEHLSFFITGVLYWWHVVGAGPKIHRRFPLGLRIGYLLVTIPPNMLTGVAIAFASEPVYTYYTTVPRILGLSVMQDQMIGGFIMWVPGSMMYIIAVLALTAGYLQAESEKPPLPESEWATDEAMIAPGWNNQ
ncbi:MAG: cytochrome c oxidase assembly protein [Anaerolineae bacterium]